MALKVSKYYIKVKLSTPPLERVGRILKRKDGRNVEGCAVERKSVLYNPVQTGVTSFPFFKK